MFELDHLLAAAFIFTARVVDVALGTFRFALVVGGWRTAAWAIAFVEASVWLLAASRVFRNLDDPLFAIAFALGFATGTFAGMTIERFFALGEQALRVFTKDGARVATALRDRGYRVTRFSGEGRDGPTDLLYIQLPRREATTALDLARKLDPDCYYVVEDIRAAAAARRAAVPIRR